MEADLENDSFVQLHADNETTPVSSNDSGIGPRFEDVTQQLYFQVPLLIMYTIVFFTGTIGNLLVCYVVLTRSHMQNTTNFFILNLAVADIMLCLLAPFTVLYTTVIGFWIFGSFLCRIVPLAQCLSCYISSLTLLSIAIDRYVVICHPWVPKMKDWVCFASIVLIWVVSFLVALPYAIFLDHSIDEKGVAYCQEAWPNDKARVAFGMATLFLQFTVPFIIISWCYIRISLQLRRRQVVMAGTRSAEREEESKDKNRKINRMLIAMVVIFAVAWLPTNLINFANDLSKTFSKWEYSNVIFFIFHCLAMSSTCYNPFLYAWLNENFRKEFLKVLPCFVEMAARRSSSRLRRRQARSEAKPSKVLLELLENKTCIETFELTPNTNGQTLGDKDLNANQGTLNGAAQDDDGEVVESRTVIIHNVSYTDACNTETPLSPRD